MVSYCDDEDTELMQRFTLIPPFRNKLLDLEIADHAVPAFYSQDIIAIVEIEIDPGLLDKRLQLFGDLLCRRLIPDICFEDLHYFHIVRNKFRILSASRGIGSFSPCCW